MTDTFSRTTERAVKLGDNEVSIESEVWDDGVFCINVLDMLGYEIAFDSGILEMSDEPRWPNLIRAHEDSLIEEIENLNE